MPGLKIGVLVSGGGTNLQSVIDATQDGTLASRITCVISNKEEAYGLVRARENGIQDIFINPKEANYNEQVLEALKKHEVELVVLAGYLKIVDTGLIEAYKGRIINIHPSLLPKYGGKGYYGLYVHEAVIAAGETESGGTVHYVNEGIDTGEIILQRKVPVYQEDTPQILQQRVLAEVEHKILPEAIACIERGINP
ncbi:MAG: phosphoribosylglycinamide formyltransferase [Cellulosilyticaceae bacterium]